MQNIQQMQNINQARNTNQSQNTHQTRNIYQFPVYAFARSYKTDAIKAMTRHLKDVDYARQRLIDEGLPPMDGVYLIGLWNSSVDNGFGQIDFTIDPKFGTLSDLEEFIREAHARELRVGPDFIPGHTSNKSDIALKCLQGVAGYRNALVTVNRAQATILAQNGVACYFQGCAPFTFYNGVDFAVRTKFRPEQPALNPRNPNVRNYLRNGIQYIQSLGFDFVRVDTPTLTFEAMDNADPDNPFATLETERSLDYVHWLCQGVPHFDELFFPEDVRYYEGRDDYKRRDNAYALNASYVLDGKLHLAEWQGSRKVVQNADGHDQMPVANRGLDLRRDVLPYTRGCDYFFCNTASVIGWKSSGVFRPEDRLYDADPSNPAKRWMARGAYEPIARAFRAKFLA